MDLGSANGLNYRINAVGDVPASSTRDDYAACGEGDVAISGGIDMVDPVLSPGVPDGATMGETYPDTDGGLSVWRTRGTNLGPDPVDMDWYAICADPADVVFKTHKKTVQPGEKIKVGAACPSGYEVAGGGIRTPGAIIGSIPYDDKDRNDRREDGWKVTGYNAGDSAFQLRAIASCVSARDWDLSYQKEGSANQGPGYVHAFTDCPEGGALAGMGAKARGGTGPEDIRILEIYPYADFMEVTPSAGMGEAEGMESSQISGTSAFGTCRL